MVNCINKDVENMELLSPAKPDLEASVSDLIIDSGMAVSEEVILDWYKELYRSMVCNDIA